MTTHRLPTFAISHGGGPWPWIKDMFPGHYDALEESLQGLPHELPATPRAVLAVSAHWETDEFTVQTGAQPPMLYDYGGFPDFTYQIQYPAPGAPEVAERVVELLGEANIDTRRDADRGFDHGVFSPLFVSYPAADMPIVQLSIVRDFDPERHLEVGRALRPLRDEGVLIVGSGFPSFHDLSAFGPVSTEASQQFDAWLTDTVVNHVGADRNELLEAWTQAPSARKCHRREEHLVPLFVAVGAAEDEPGAVQYHEDAFMGWMASSGYRFG